MHPAIGAASVVLGLVGLLSWAYAGWRMANGSPFEESLPLVTSGLVCFALIAVFAASGRKRKG